ncbi:putative transcription factor MADS-type1 family [Helianthus annuus]|nr:putative transcription factor MADS-type1 family [Helianthus annuus]KAJ0471171.1 putative transcription factor MADS-type1 family [Helianthus annuus]KAJ0658208.1 putative transcription factor MADS-type1 family [Helianthus annuus]KAJ0661881.1 putative transcription factor MADS-type1 family [Helianthus annuus]KAJ0842517.1 putative transcription factor MADS-type1 family [Helianthus annuus]
MARARVKLARILNESKRRAAVKKRRLALIKSLQALCVLCKVKACMIVCDGLNDQSTDNVMVWPSRKEVKTMVAKFNSVSEQKQKKKMVTHEKFLENMLVNEKSKLQALKKKNDQMEIEEILHKLHSAPTSIDLESGKLSQAYFYIEELIKMIEEKESSS